MPVRVMLKPEGSTDVAQGESWTNREPGRLVVFDARGQAVAEFPASTWRGIIKLHEVQP